MAKSIFVRGGMNVSNLGNPADITSVYVVGVAMDTKMATTLQQFMLQCEHITSITIDMVHFHVDAFRQFLKGLKTSQPRIKYMVLQRSGLGYNEMETLANFLKSAYALTVLNLDLNNFGDASTGMLGACFGPEHKLEEISMCANNVGSVGAVDLFKKLYRSPHIVSISLAGNPRINDQGAMGIANYVHFFASVWLAKCSITKKGVQAMVDAQSGCWIDIA